MNKKFIYCDLSSQVIEIKEIAPELEERKAEAFSLALGLYKEYKDLSPIVISGANLNTRLKGSNVFSIVFFSPVTKSVRYVYSNVSFGLALSLLGFDAIVIVGHSRKLTYLEVSTEQPELKLCEQLRDSSPMRFSQIVSNLATNEVLSIGRTGEKRVLLSSLFYNGEMDIGSYGLGAVFGESNLKGVIVRSPQQVLSSEKSDLEYDKKIKKTHVLRQMSIYGNNYMLHYGNKYGFLPLDNYCYRIDPRVMYLTGKIAYVKRMKFANTCLGCKINCNARDENGVLLPRFEEVMSLGLNLGFFSIDHIKLLTEAVREEGLCAVETGALLSYLKTLKKVDYTLPDLYNAPVEEFVRVIHLIGDHRVLGERLGQGLLAFPQAIQMADGSAVLCDLRGVNLQAVFLSIGEKALCFPDLMFGLSYHGSVKSQGALAFYCQLLTHVSLISSIPPELLTCLAFGKKYKRLLLRTTWGVNHYIKKLDKAMLKALSDNISLYRELNGEPMAIPEYFIKNPKSNKDDKTVPYNALMFYYDWARSKLLSFLSDKDHNSARS